MKTNVLSFLGVKQDEQLPVFLMLSTGFFIGIFIATYQVTAESLFLNRLSDQLDKAFLISGVLGIISTSIFSYFQNRIRFIVLAIISFLLIIVATYLLHYSYHNENEANQKIALFAMYCLIGPMSAILLLCYWGLFGRIFNFKQSKRIIGWIDTGQLIAIIAANFFIPLTSSLIPDTSDYLWVCNLSMVGALTSVVIISLNFNLVRVNTDPEVRENTKFSVILKDRYVLLLSLFLVLSMVTFIFNQYTFQTLLNKQYPNQRDLTDFLAFFNGAIYALSLVMQVFINDKIISTYGIRISLFILPAVVALLTFFSVMIGSLLGFDSTVSPTNFIYFFLFISLTRLFNSMLRDSLENPIYKLLFIPLDNRFRFSIQAKVEGIINESGRLVAGGFIFIFTLIPFFSIIWVPLIVLALVGLYFLVIRNLYNEYKSKIRSKLESSGHTQDALEIGYAKIVDRLESNLVVSDASTNVFSYKLLEKINPSGISSWINTLMKNRDDNSKQFAQVRMNELKGLSVSDNYIIKLDSRRVNSSSKKMLSKIDLDSLLSSDGEIPKSRIQKLVRSFDANDRHYAAELLLHTTNKEFVGFLIELLNDLDNKVRSVAIKTSIKRYNSEVIAALIENLTSPIHANAAMNALIQIGDPTLSLLDNAFYRSGQSSQVMIRIIQVIGSIGKTKSKEILWNKIDYPDKVIGSHILLALGKSGFKAGLNQVSRIKYAIESDIGDIAWNLSAISELKEDNETSVVKSALEEEVQNDIEHVYMLLAMLYDTRSIQLVKENIDSGTAEGIAYAIELLDVFLSEQLKQRVIPVLDDIGINEKANRLQLYYPRINLDDKLVLKFLLNRDFVQSNRWTKATVLHQIGKRKLSEFTLDLIAQLYNPDNLISETAAWALYEINPSEYEISVSRIGKDFKRRIDKIVFSEDRSVLMNYDKTYFLKSIDLFNSVSGLTLSYLADISTSLRLERGVDFAPNDSKFYMVFEGTLQNFQLNRPFFNRGDFIGEHFYEATSINQGNLRVVADAILLQFDKDSFYELLSEKVRLAEKILDYVRK